MADETPINGASELARGDGDLKGAGDAHQLDVVVVGAGAMQRVERRGEQALGDELVEARDHDAETETAGVKMTGGAGVLGFGRRFGFVLPSHVNQSLELFFLPRRHGGTEKTKEKPPCLRASVVNPIFP